VSGIDVSRDLQLSTGWSAEISVVEGTVV